MALLWSPPGVYPGGSFYSLFPSFPRGILSADFHFYAGDTQLYQQVMSQEALQGAAIKGTGKALDRVAKFYLDMAENMFPVIEVDAARKIEVIVTRGASLSLATSQGGGARR